MIIKHYVEFYYAGVFFGETSTEEIQERDFEKIVLPKNSYGFQFYDIAYKTINGIELKSEAINESNRYIYGESWTLEEVKERLSDEKVLIRNMESNRWDKVIKTKVGNFIPYDDDIELIKEAK